MFETRNWMKMAAVLAAAALVATAGCGDDEDAAEETPATEVQPAETEALPEETEPAPEPTEAAPVETEPEEPLATEAPEPAADESAATEAEAPEAEPTLGMRLCEAWGGVHEPGGLEQLLALMTEDVVVTDTQLGADLVGHEAVAAYVTSDAFAPWDIMECGAILDVGAWGAGAYTLSSTTQPGSGQGITAVHEVDGLVDRQVMYYTGTEERAPAPSTELVDNSTVEAYCQAWDDGVDTDTVLSYVADDIEFTASEVLVGKDALAEFIETDFVFDEAVCGDGVVENGEWAAGAAVFTDTASGLVFEGVNILRIDADGLVAEHHPHYDAGA